VFNIKHLLKIIYIKEQLLAFLSHPSYSYNRRLKICGFAQRCSSDTELKEHRGHFPKDANLNIKFTSHTLDTG